MTNEYNDITEDDRLSYKIVVSMYGLNNTEDYIMCMKSLQSLLGVDRFV